MGERRGPGWSKNAGRTWGQRRKGKMPTQQTLTSMWGKQPASKRSAPVAADSEAPTPPKRHASTTTTRPRSASTAADAEAPAPPKPKATGSKGKPRPIFGKSATLGLVSSSIDENIAKGRAAGGIERVLQGLNNARTCGVVEQGLGVLQALCVESHHVEEDGVRCQENCRRVIKLEPGVRIIIKAIRSYVADAAIQARGFDVLAALCEEDDWPKYCLGRCDGAIEAIVSALDAHGTHARVQESGCRALASALLHVPFEGLPNDKNLRLVKDAGGVEAVVRALKAHASIHEVQEAGCSFLRVFCEENGSDCRRLVIRAGGLDAAVEALKAHRSDPSVQEAACGAIWSICEDEKEGKRRAGRNGGLEAVVEALRAHVAEARVQESGCGALCSICDNVHEDDFAGGYSALVYGNCSLIGKAGGVEAVVEALKTHKTDALVQQHGCAALHLLCHSNELNRSRALAAGGLNAVKQAIKTHKRNFRVELCGSDALHVLEEGPFSDSECSPEESFEDLLSQLMP